MAQTKLQKRKRAPGGGRKPLDAKGVKDIALRIPKELVRQIDHFADQNGIKRSGAIRRLLSEGIVRNQPRGLHIEALLAAIGMNAAANERLSGKPWNRDAETAATLRNDIVQLIEHFVPEAVPLAASPKLSAAGIVILSIENAERYRKPYDPLPGGFVHDGLPLMLHHLDSGLKRRRRITGQ
jgi:hypothetical protein